LIVRLLQWASAFAGPLILVARPLLFWRGAWFLVWRNQVSGVSSRRGLGWDGDPALKCGAIVGHPSGMRWSFGRRVAAEMDKWANARAAQRSAGLPGCGGKRRTSVILESFSIEVPEAEVFGGLIKPEDGLVVEAVEQWVITGAGVEPCGDLWIEVPSGHKWAGVEG